MTDPLNVVFISAGSAAFSAIVATLLTIFLTPRLQHYFWKHQRFTERRLTAIDEINKLTANFAVAYSKDPENIPDKDFFVSFIMLSGEMKVLFSKETYELFKKMEIMIGPNLGPAGKRTLDDFINARDSAMKALYKEAGIV